MMPPMILCLGTTPALQRVMMFGDFTLDEVNRASRTLDGAAGKSINVAKTLKVLGVEPLAVGFLGGDRGGFIRQTLDGAGVAHEFLEVSARTRECVTILDEHAGTTTELVEESGLVTLEEFRGLQEVVRRRLVESRAVVLSGTLAPGVPETFYRDSVAWARERHLPVVLDAKGAPLTLALEAGPDVVKPNRAELASTVGRPLSTMEEVRDAMVELGKRGARGVVVTEGEGAVLAWDGRQGWRIQPPTIPAVNPIGSGDAFTAGLTWRMLEGDSLGEASRWGAACGTANALTLMAGEVDRAEVERLAGMVRVAVW